MKIFKPHWVHHEENHPIFSIDIHPDGSRFVTGGQGDDNGKIIIWNMQPIRDRLKDLDETSPKILCQMDHHLACVNCVRWSNQGNFLASGSDDKLIMIWQYSSTSSYQNVENWKCSYTLRGHEGDVLDLAWSYKDNLLASTSVDNTIIVWNALKFPEILKRIEAHNGLVKGVCWDPADKYLASQSDDKTLKVWCTSDWSLEKCIDEPFKGCSGTTHVLRLSWSPDGNLLVSAHAMNNGMPTAQIIERQGWKTKLDFVGHEKAVTVVRFYPQILKQNEQDNDKFYCLCAVGSRDHSLSLWLTQYQRPIAVIQDLFSNPVMDITWTKSGPIGLLSCSYDGTVAYCEFSNEEIGHSLNKQELETFFKVNYSVDLNERPVRANQTQEKLKFIENIDVLLAQETKENKEPVKIKDEITANNRGHSSSNSSNLVNETQTQIERKLPDGRRRITPICVSKTGDFEAPKPFVGVCATSTTQITGDIQFKSSTATESSTIIVEKRDETNEIISRSPAKSIQNSSSQDHFQFMNQVKEQQEKIKLAFSAGSEPTPAAAIDSTTAVSAINVTKKPNPTNVPIKQPIVPQKIIQPSQPVKPQPLKKPQQMVQKNNDQATNGVESHLVESTQKNLKLKVIKFEQNKTARRIFINKMEFTMEIENFLNNNKSLHQFRLCDKNILKWSYLFNEPIESCVNSMHIISIYTQERLVYFFNAQNGNLLCSPILLDNSLAAHKTNQNYILCLTTNGYLYLWQYNIQNASLINLISQLSCEMLFHYNNNNNNNDATFLNCKLTSNGIPIIYMSNNKVYYYSVDNFKCWHLLPNQHTLSQSFSASCSDLHDGLLNMHQIKDTNNELMKTIEKLNTNNDDLKNDFTMRHLESQLNAALDLNSPKEYKFWLMTYVRYLCDNSYEDKLKDLCNFLLGPSHSLEWTSTILIYSKHELLKEVLTIIRLNINMQRLYTLCKQQLDLRLATNESQQMNIN